MTFTEKYNQFLASKIKLAPLHGHTVAEDQLLTSLFPFQKKAVCWALQGGRRALFESFGLGKTRQQLQIALEVMKHTGKSFLIGLPLGMKGEFAEEYEQMMYEHKKQKRYEGWEADAFKNFFHPQIFYVTDQKQIDKIAENYGPCIFLSNYERIREGNFDPAYFGGVSFDEAAVLRSLDTLTSDYIINHFSVVPYRYVCTATPSPNEYTEILNYAHFLGVIDRGQGLTRFFQRNSTKAGNLTLYPHKEQEFWLWVSSWALFITKPSDITGNADDDMGYNLPSLHVQWHKIDAVNESNTIDRRTGNLQMYANVTASLPAAAKEKRSSIAVRVHKMKTLIAEQDPALHWLIWHHLEDERRAIETALPGCKTVYGSQDMQQREDYLIGFGNGTYQYMATKPEIAGSGNNFQKHCHSVIYLGINYDFNDFIQSLHRVYRFLQTNEVNVHIFYTESEEPIKRKLLAKWQRHNEMIAHMTEIIRTNGLNNTQKHADLKRTMGVNRKEVEGKWFKAIHNDTVLECATMKDDSIGLVLTSIPFSDQYEYCESYHDMGHNEGDALFFEQMGFLTQHLLRVLQPGRIAAIHVKDRIQYSYQTGSGFISLNPFSDKVIKHFQENGFWFMSRITIPTDVVQENNQTYRLGYSEMCKDASKMGNGLPEYVLIFRKAPTDKSDGYADVPVTKDKAEYSLGRWQINAHDIWQSNFNRLLMPEEIRQMHVDKISKWWKWYDNNHVYEMEEHVQLTDELDAAGRLPKTFALLPPWQQSEQVWNGINRMNTLNTKQAQKKREKHVCPLQFDIVDRLIVQYSNKGDVVFDPYGGLMTVPYRCIMLGRYGIGVELNELYWKDGVQYCKMAAQQQQGVDLFTVMSEEV